MQRIGIMGGSFDPVHNGHIALAEAARDELGLDAVYVIPAGKQPFKLNKKMTPAEDRLEMVRLACEGKKGLVASDFEIKSPEISYTKNTLDAFREKFGKDTEIYFITGTDAFIYMDTWMCGEEILRNYHIAVGTRPGYKTSELTEAAERFEKLGASISRVENPQIDISATELRSMAEEGLPLRDYVCEAVERYIEKNGLYK